MAKQTKPAEPPVAAAADEPRERRLARVFSQVVELLIDLDSFDRQRVLSAVDAMFPSKLTVKPSPNAGVLP